jgi:hypothetical protein
MMQLSQGPDGTFQFSGMTADELTYLLSLTGQVAANSECQIFSQIYDAAPDECRDKHTLIDADGRRILPIVFRSR